MLEIALETLESRRGDPAIQMQCVKGALQLIEGQQDRIEPKKNVNLNANLNCDFASSVDFNNFRNR